MPIGPDAAVHHPDQGMTPADMKAVAKVAAERDEIIMFRDTGCWSRPYIALGHPTKPFHVKGKSSDWGPHAGLVPYNSEFSKAFKQKDIDKGFALNKQAIKENYARPIPLFLDLGFIEANRLSPIGSGKRPPIDKMTAPRDGVLYFYATKPNDDPSAPGKKYVLMGKKVQDGRYQIYTFPPDAPVTDEKQLFLKESVAEPMLVMTVPGADLPITGDYDLFAICPSWKSYGRADQKMDPTLDNPQQNASYKRTQARIANGSDPNTLIAANSKKQIDAAKTPEDPDRGNLTPRILAVVHALVAAMGGKYPRVHHNAESGRPFAPGAEDGFPLTTFHPKIGVGGYNFLDATINDLGDLKDYFTKLYAGGYYPPRNHAWKMPNLRDDSVVKAQLVSIFNNRRI
jgi:hypothetical protein